MRAWAWMTAILHVSHESPSGRPTGAPCATMRAWPTADSAGASPGMGAAMVMKRSSAVRTTRLFMHRPASAHRSSGEARSRKVRIRGSYVSHSELHTPAMSAGSAPHTARAVSFMRACVAGSTAMVLTWPTRNLQMAHSPESRSLGALRACRASTPSGTLHAPAAEHSSMGVLAASNHWMATGSKPSTRLVHFSRAMGSSVQMSLSTRLTK
mmetsp:Transcript_33624/g.85151  ORF Transcript_33624/g.85151 Transcript_33624/m.85151 type:complete len:211 (-) Transcript_33624:314-946(-)